MTKQELLQLHENLCGSARALMQAKNEDYAHGTDAFRNFRRHGAMGVLVRLSDKLARLDSFEERGTFSVQSEGLGDTVQDIVNYAIIYLALKKEAEVSAAPIRIIATAPTLDELHDASR